MKRRRAKDEPTKPEAVSLGRWIPVARRVRWSCCGCGHAWRVEARVRKASVEIRVTE